MTKHSAKPVAQHIDTFLEYCAIEKGLSETTQRNYKAYLRVLTRWLTKTDRQNCLPHELTEDVVWQYRLYLAKTHKTHTGSNLTKRSQNYYLGALRALLGYFHHRKIDALSPAHVTLAKTSTSYAVEFLPFVDVLKLLEVPDVNTDKGLRDRAIMELLFSTGLRVSELASLDTEHVATVTKHKKATTIEISITGKGGVTRTVYISPRAAQWLRQYLSTRADDHKPLFINYASRVPDAKRLTPRAIQNMIRQVSALAGISKKITPHTLRHSYATDLLGHGADLRSVQELLGHKNVATTQIYTHLTNTHLRRVHEKFHANGEDDANVNSP